MRRRVSSFIAALAVCGAATTAITQATSQDQTQAPILHEDVTPPADQVARTAERAAARSADSGQAVLGPSPTQGQNPQAISAGPKLLPEPSSAAPKSESETVFGDASFGADRDTSTRPDYDTGSDGTLSYVEVFNPSIVPFKRMTSLDSIGPDYTLKTNSSSTTEVPVGGERRAGRELFWGSVVIKLKTGRDIPIPSVSADMGILSYEIEPNVGLTFSKDRADNYYVRSDEPGLQGSHRLVFLADAGARHFSPRTPSRLKVSDIPKHLLRPIPKSVRRSAAAGLKRLRLNRHVTLRFALDTLVRYFRNFEAREPPPRTKDIYWDLFANQAGVCRHRAFAFMVTANALGIPTRYLSNEAHAWVEVYLPKQGWVRIDLGGAAVRLEVANADGKAMHDGGVDPFPKPPKYENNYAQLAGDVDGLTREQINERRERKNANNQAKTTDDGDVAFFDDTAPATDSQRQTTGGRLVGPGKGLPPIPSEELATKRRTITTVSSVSPRGYRGETITISGSLTTDKGEGIGNQFINIFLMAKDDEEESERVGYTMTNADGFFRAEVEIRGDLPLAEYGVYAAARGDDTYAPSLSD